MMEKISYCEENVTATYGTLESTDKKVFSISVTSLLEEVFGVKIKLKIDEARILYMLIRGEEQKEMLRNLKLKNEMQVKPFLSFIYKNLDVKSSKEMMGKIINWCLQRNNVLLLPSEDYITEPLTLEEALDRV